MLLTRRVAGLLLLAGVFQWVVWPVFLKNISADPRAFHPGPTGFFWVHAVLTVLSLGLGTWLFVLGARGWRAARGG